MYIYIFCVFIPGSLNKLRCWFKGNDTTTFCVYMEAKLNEILPTLDAGDQPYFREMVRLFTQANQFMRLIFGAGLWLTKLERQAVINCCEGFLTCYQTCASFAFSKGLCRWKIQPKYHMTAELLYTLKFEALNKQPSLNPISFSTQVDEDFVGRVATMSRHVSSRTLHERTLRRYLLHLKSDWD